MRTFADTLPLFYIGEAKLELLVEALDEQKITATPDNAKKVLVELKTLFSQLLKGPLPVIIRAADSSGDSLPACLFYRGLLSG